MDFYFGLKVVGVCVVGILVLVSLFDSLPTRITGTLNSPQPTPRKRRPGSSGVVSSPRQREVELRRWFDAMSASPLYWYQEK